MGAKNAKKIRKHLKEKKIYDHESKDDYRAIDHTGPKQIVNFKKTIYRDIKKKLSRGVQDE